MRIGLIGCGDWGSTLARVLSDMGVLFAICDADANRAAALSRELGVPAIGVDPLIADASVTAMVLALPPGLQSDPALRVLQAGKHLLIEKPMALTLEAAQRIVDQAQTGGLIAMTGHLLRFHPGFQALMAMVSDNTLGPIRHIRSTRAGLGKVFPDADVLWDFAPHDLAMHLALSGELPETVRMKSVALTPNSKDMADLRLVYPSGLSSHIHVSRISPEPERKLTLFGETATAVFDDLLPDARKVAVYRHEPPPTRGFGRMTVDGPHYQPLPPGQPLQAELTHFIDCITGNLSPVSSVAEGLDVLRVIARASTPHNAQRNGLSASGPTRPGRGIPDAS